MFGFGKSKSAFDQAVDVAPDALQPLAPELKSAETLSRGDVARHVSQNLRDMCEVALAARLELAACMIELAAEITVMESRDEPVD